jgi:O-antigen ligase
VTTAALAALSWGVFALGAVYPWGYWPLSWGALVAGVLGLRHGPGFSSTIRHPVSLALLALGSAVALQLMPLPPAVLRTVSPATLGFIEEYMQVPEAAAAAATGATDTAAVARSRPISLRPRATGTALMLVLALGVMVAGGAAGLGVRDARRLAAGIVALGVAVALVALVQRSTYNGRILWFWEARYSDTAFGPFVNRNHFAGWMVMAISMGLGYFMARAGRSMRDIEGWRSRVLWLSSPEAAGVVLSGAALAVMGLTLVLTASRSGTGCFIAAMMVVIAAAMRTRARTRLPGRRRTIMVVYVASLAAFTVIGTGLPAMADRFSSPGTSTPYALGERLNLWRDALQVMRRFPVTGTGLNTYTAVTPFFQTGVTPTSDEAHNDYLQLAAEGGLLVGLPALALVVTFAREVLRRFRAGRVSVTSYWLRVGAVAGLIAIALQESVEFSLQLPGNAVMFAALCAVALHAPEPA